MQHKVVIQNRQHSHRPRRTALILAMSMLPMSIIAAKTRLDSAPPADSASINTRGVICQEMPQRSLHQPHALSAPLIKMDAVMKVKGINF
jgi:hypothetical protein